MLKTLDELLVHLCASSTLSYDQAKRIVEEVLAFYDEPVEDYVLRRHRDLQAQGYTNSKIYTFVAEEVTHRRFPSTALTERQIRRMIYG